MCLFFDIFLFPSISVDFAVVVSFRPLTHLFIVSPTPSRTAFQNINILKRCNRKNYFGIVDAPPWIISKDVKITEKLLNEFNRNLQFQCILFLKTPPTFVGGKGEHTLRHGGSSEYIRLAGLSVSVRFSIHPATQRKGA